MAGIWKPVYIIASDAESDIDLAYSLAIKEPDI